MVQCFSWVLGVPTKDVYAGIGHCEPIHMDEAIAYFLTVGRALIPRELPDIPVTGYMLIEGIAVNDEPHMIGLNTTKIVDFSKVATREQLIHCSDIYSPGNLDLLTLDIYWYVLPCHINSEFIKLHKVVRSRWVSAIQRAWGAS
jgi:hypothetical protein